MQKHLRALAQDLLAFVMENGTPFTRITYSANEGLKIDNDDTAEALYRNTFQSFDKPIYDDKGNLIGIKTVSYKKAKVKLSADDIERIVYGMEGESVGFDNKDFVALEDILKILARYGIKLDEQGERENETNY